MAASMDPIKLPIKAELDTASLKAAAKVAADLETSLNKATEAARRFGQAGVVTAAHSGFDPDLLAMMDSGGKTDASGSPTGSQQEQRKEELKELRQQRQDESLRRNRLQASPEGRFQLASEQYAARQEHKGFQQQLQGQPGLSFGQRLAGTVQSSASIYTLASLAQGNASPIGLAFTNALLRTITAPSAGGAAGSGMLGRLLGGGAGSAAGGALAGAGDAGLAGGGGGILEGLMGAMGPILGAVGLAAGGGMYYSSQSADVMKWQNQLGANIGGRFRPQSMLSQLIGGGQRFFKDAGTTVNTAAALGQEGVSARDMNAQTQNTLAASVMTGEDPSQLTGLIGAMARGGMGPEAVAQAFEVMDEQAAKSGISLNKITDGLKSLAAAGGTLTQRGVYGALGVQSLLGTGISGSALLSPLQSATGAQAISAAATLGLSPDAFQGMQGNQDQLFDRASKILQRNTKGYSGAMRTDVAESMLSGMGIMNLQGLTPAQQQTVVGLMLKDQGRQAQDAAARMQADNFVGTGGDFRKQAAMLAGSQTSMADQLKLAAMDNIYLKVNEMAGNISRVADKLAPKAGGPASATHGGLQLYEQQHGGQSVRQDILGVTFPDGSTLTWDQFNKLRDNGYAGGPNPPGKKPGGDPRLLHTGTPTGINMKVGGQTLSYTDPTLMQNLYDASQKYGIPLQELVAQAYQESSMGANTPPGTGGIAQFTGPARDDYFGALGKAKNSPYYDKTSPYYGMGFDENNQGQGLAAMAWYDKNNPRGGTLAGYNGSGQAAAAYQARVQRLEIGVTVTGTVNASGQAAILGKAHKVVAQSSTAQIEHVVDTVGRLFSHM